MFIQKTYFSAINPHKTFCKTDKTKYFFQIKKKKNIIEKTSEQKYYQPKRNKHQLFDSFGRANYFLQKIKRKFV